MFKVKYHPDGSIKRYKRQLVAQGFAYVHEIDYIEIFALKIRRESLSIFLAIVTMIEMILLQINIIGAYLKSLLGQDERYPIYLIIPQRCRVGQKDVVCKILKNLYA